MKQSKFLSTLLIIFVAVFAVGVGLKVYWSMANSKPVTPKLAYVLRPSKTEIKVGEHVTVPVYLTGDDTPRVSAFDIKFNYDTTKLKLVSAVPGTFFDKYLTVKWDQKTSWFALAMNPSTKKTPPTLTSPILTLEFIGVQKTDSTAVSTGVSTVYVTETGGFQPTSDSTNFIIK